MAGGEVKVRAESAKKVIHVVKPSERTDLPAADQAQAPAAPDEKISPYNPEAERWLLGRLLMDGEQLDEIAETISPDDFGNKRHQFIFEAMVAVASHGESLDMASVIQWLIDTNNDGNAGGIDYLQDLFISVPSTAHLRDYAELIRSLSVRRKLRKAAERIAQNAFRSKGKSPLELLDEAENEIFGIADQSIDEMAMELNEKFCEEIVDWLRAREAHQGAVTGLPTGLREFDSLTTGLQPGDLIVLAGRPGLGKTSLAMCIAQEAALNPPGFRRAGVLAGNDQAATDPAYGFRFDRH